MEPPKRGHSRKGNRERLLKAALELIEVDQSGLAGLSLRQITKQCGLSPPAFYNHFSSTEELGLALVEEAGSVLRGLLKAVREVNSLDTIIADSLSAAFGYIQDNPTMFVMIARERGGSSLRIRMAIRREVRQIVEDMASDFESLGFFPHFGFQQLRAAVAAVISLGLNLIPDFLDASSESTRAADDVLKEFEFQVRLILRGAQAATDDLPTPP